MEPDNLAELLYQRTVDQLKPLARMCGPTGVTRKAELINHIIATLTSPDRLKSVWEQLDGLSQKAVAAAYHNDGEFNAASFAAQYGALPERPRKNLWAWYSEPIMLDLFIYNGLIPSDLMPFLGSLVPPPERFQIIGLENPPMTLFIDGYAVELTCAETEQTGPHDLIAYLRLVDQGQIKISNTSSRATLGSIKKIHNSLLAGDFFPLAEKYRGADTIRAFGLDVFAQEAKLVSKRRGATTLTLTRRGKAFYKSQDAKLLLKVFEIWTESGRFDELSRIPAIKGQKAKGTRLTKPASRREAVIEALSWCPAGVWIDIEDFYRAVKIWHFDFEVENSSFSNLYIGYREYGMLYGETYWSVTKGLYINAVIWEYLGSIGAVDLLYTAPEEVYFEAGLDYYYDDDYLSQYDGLKYFRINNLGAFLLGQAEEYISAAPDVPPLFTISANQTVTLSSPDQLTPNDQFLLEQVAVSRSKGRYKLDTQRLLTALEEGADLTQLTEFLTTRHAGPFPEAVVAWLETAEQNSRAFNVSGQALLVKARSPELAELAATDPVLQKYCKKIDQQTLVIPTNREKQFRTRLKELAYILAN